MKGKDWAIVVLLVLLCSLITGCVVFFMSNDNKQDGNLNTGKSLFDFSLGDFTFKTEENETEITEEKETNVIEGTCIYCDGPLEEDDKKSVCKSCKDDPMAYTGGRHMESVAPYGRCPRCEAALASDKSYQGDYCDDCFAAIKQEEYEEKHQYGDCVDCGVYLTKNQASSYGGRCPDCYAAYYGDYDTNMGSCDRCGDRVDLDHTNDGWGYSNLCSYCTGELQSEESAEDATPWAG